MNDDVKAFLRKYSERQEYDCIFLFFNEICGYEADYSMFLTKEIMEGNL